ncbi:tripartite tricarboxylate transporter TctB family protein [Curvibacter sp. CHRR-16]|uniref:tripartite tricarboxylate transporter TctB family protein n=1 Tax=Curvibacter sp. CHRR-16 TaxID=2835872 RepID=UPI001BD9DDFD|nr:tripartite tricarboxylate transporter TctB family protein [Curvibacter sp. CHRR-16]MBT0569252.1 tripartite tricarboxylate transporter TctB family protein [Curvibacter sp. CHRR-16]
MKTRQTLIGVGVLAVALTWAIGAWDIPSDAGYGGVGPDFLPWLVALVLGVCGVLLVWHAQTTGFRVMEEVEADAPPPYWLGFAWMSAGVLLNAALITTIGFILSCTLAFVCAARGMRMAQGEPAGGMRSWVVDVVLGLLISAPVYWMFTKFLAISLPGLTSTGWL